MKSIDLKLFINSGFDIECKFTRLPDFDWVIGSSDERTFNTGSEWIYRPRLNHKFALNDYGKVAVDGLVWSAEFFSPESYSSSCASKNARTLASVELESLSDNSDHEIVFWIASIECIGVEASKGYDEWADQRDMDVIKL